MHYINKIKEQGYVYAHTALGVKRRVNAIPPERTRKIYKPSTDAGPSLQSKPWNQLQGPEGQNSFHVGPTPGRDKQT